MFLSSILENEVYLSGHQVLASEVTEFSSNWMLMPSFSDLVCWNWCALIICLINLQCCLVSCYQYFLNISLLVSFEYLGAYNIVSRLYREIQKVHWNLMMILIITSLHFFPVTFFVSFIVKIMVMIFTSVALLLYSWFPQLFCNTS